MMSMFNWFRQAFAPSVTSDCDCFSTSNMHAQSCELAQRWLDSFGYDGSYPLPAVIDLSDTRFAR